jgi:hypothetical protein
MPELSAIELLNAWENSRGSSPIHQALMLLSAAHRETIRDDLARLPIGRRDSLLLDLRRQLFGQELIGVAKCPSCHERLEFDFRVSDVTISGVSDNLPDDHTLNVDGYQIRFHLPNSFDLMAVTDMDEAKARQEFLQRCVNQVSRNGSEIDLSELPPPVVEMLNRHMASLDPQADIEIDLSCPECDHRWSDLFDVATYLWEEIDRWARRTLEEVHILASKYGWRQDDILNLSAWRRQAYVELVQNR